MDYQTGYIRNNKIFPIFPLFHTIKFITPQEIISSIQRNHNETLSNMPSEALLRATYGQPSIKPLIKPQIIQSVMYQPPDGLVLNLPHQICDTLPKNPCNLYKYPTKYQPHPNLEKYPNCNISKYLYTI